MSLILYPTENYDTFISIINCDTLLTANVIGSQREAYANLIDTDKEIYIRQATTLIKNDITLPYTLEDDLQLATAYLVNHSVGIVMTNGDKSSNVKEKEIDGVVRTVYFSPNSDVNDFPDICQSLLSQYDGASDGSFVLERA